MKQLSFEVREIHQSGSGGSHVVKYSGELNLLDASEPIAVEMLSVYPPNSTQETIEIARQMIQRGAVRALDGTGNAAHVRVRDFLIHPVDFKPSYVEEYTYRALRKLLAGGC